MKNYRSLLFVLGLLCCIACSTDAPPKQTTSTVPTKTTEETPVDKVQKDAKKTIVFFGNSLTAAYGLEASQGFAGLIDHRLDSLGLPYEVVNAGLSGETTAGGNERIDWILEHHHIDVFILELGGNDALRGLKVEQSYENLQSIIDKVKKKFPVVKIVLAGMLAPPNMGPKFTDAFKAMYPTLAQKNEATLIPFLLEGVAGMPKLNLPDGIHPNVVGHRIVTENIWKILQPIL